MLSKRINVHCVYGKQTLKLLFWQLKYFLKMKIKYISFHLKKVLIIFFINNHVCVNKIFIIIFH